MLPSIPIYIVPDSQVLHYVLPLVSPLLGLTSCIMSKEMFGEANYNYLKEETARYGIQVYYYDEIWYPLVIFVIQAIIFFTIVLFLDNLKFTLKDRL